MTQIRRKHKCRHCQEFFFPNYRNVGRQKYCGKPECQKVSKADSQRRWLNKPENKDYFLGSDNVERVQKWRKKRPGYSRKKKAAASNPLQDSLPENPELKQSVETHLTVDALQEVCMSQHAVIVGIISQFTGQVLQEDIAKSIGRLRRLGHDILNAANPSKGVVYDFKATHLSGSDAPDSGAVQLGGSPSGS